MCSSDLFRAEISELLNALVVYFGKLRVVSIFVDELFDNVAVTIQCFQQVTVRLGHVLLPQKES